MLLKRTWRWFGDTDAMALSELKQMGVEGVVTSLHDVKPGIIWNPEDIFAVKKRIEEAGLVWSVVESLPVSEEIKLGTFLRDEHIENYKRSLKHLAEQGVKTVCYNFMPVLDWVRTDLKYIDSDGSETMLYDHAMFAVFDLFILEREHASQDYTEPILQAAQRLYDTMSQAEREQLAYDIIIVTQGFINSAVVDSADYKRRFMQAIERYKNINPHKYRSNLVYFLSQVVPEAEKHGMRMCIHPDDPPFPILGLPRIASTIEDFQWIFSSIPSIANGLTYCTGSLAARKDNDPVAFLKHFANRVHFAHLRNLKFLDGHRFYESGHLDGDVDMYTVVKLLLEEQQRRHQEGREDTCVPFRPDHGKKMLSDFERISNPGYPAVGRLRGLSEIRGIQEAIHRQLHDKQKETA